MGYIRFKCYISDRLWSEHLQCSPNHLHQQLHCSLQQGDWSSLPPLSVEQTLARTFNWLEKLLSLYEVEGEKPILQLYYKYWLHRCAGGDFLCVGMGLHVNYLMIDYTTNSRYEERVTWKSNTNFTAINK